MALESLKEAAGLVAGFTTAANAALVEGIAERLADAFRAGKKVLICGNGGSLADAVHFAEELTGRYRADRRALPAVAIAEPGHLTCVANDYGFERVFSRGVEALGSEGDVLIVLSTSGNSANVRLAVEAAKARGMTTVGLLGKGGGVMKGLCDTEIVAPGATADRIQELHMLVLHVLVERVEVLLGLAQGKR
jgi:D-sedoheptulose 7-phosphate isomerase